MSFQFVIEDTLRRSLEKIKSLGNLVRDKKKDIESAPDGSIQNEIQTLVSEMNEKKQTIEPLLLSHLQSYLEPISSTSSTNETAFDYYTKAQLLTPYLFKQRKAIEKQLKKIYAERKIKQFDKKKHTEGLRVQRKIFHLLHHQGSGDDFYYEPTVATEKHGVNENDFVILTEKYDGTTVQATKNGVFKRKDRFTAGDRRKHAITNESERYDIERLNLDDESTSNAGINRYIKQAVNPYLHRFQSFEEDSLCCYFEAIGSHIQSRFTTDLDNKPWHDIRVFDFSLNGKFLCWRDTVILATKYQLPLVGYSLNPQTFKFDQLLEHMSNKTCGYSPSTAPCVLLLPLPTPSRRSVMDLKMTSNKIKNETSSLYHHRQMSKAKLEGYVIRKLNTTTSQADNADQEEERVAKFRVDDIDRLLIQTPPSSHSVNQSDIDILTCCCSSPYLRLLPTELFSVLSLC